MTPAQEKKAKKADLTSLKEKYEVDFMKIKYGIPSAVTKDIIKKVGSKRKKVMKALKKEALIK